MSAGQDQAGEHGMRRQRTMQHSVRRTIAKHLEIRRWKGRHDDNECRLRLTGHPRDAIGKTGREIAEDHVSVLRQTLWQWPDVTNLRPRALEVANQQFAS